MSLSNLLRRWRALIHKDAMEHELDEEMQFHLEMATRRNIERHQTALREPTEDGLLRRETSGPLRVEQIEKQLSAAFHAGKHVAVKIEP